MKFKIGDYTKDGHGDIGQIIDITDMRQDLANEPHYVIRVIKNGNKVRFPVKDVDIHCELIEYMNSDLYQTLLGVNNGN